MAILRAQTRAGVTMNFSKRSHPKSGRKQKGRGRDGSNFRLECSLFQSAGKSDKDQDVDLGTWGWRVGEGRAPFKQSRKVRAPAGRRGTQAGCGAGPGSKVPE